MDRLLFSSNRRILLYLFFLMFFFPKSLNAQSQDFLDTDDHSLSSRWELDSDKKRGTFIVTPYKPTFILPLRWTSRPNEMPASLNPNNVATERRGYDNFETRFQLSLKTKVAEGLLFGEGDLWLGFTQTANWQILNGDLSRPFRELNYEPEIIFNYPLSGESLFGIQPKMIGLALSHQSNGKSLPYSRSWNRVIFHAGFEYNNLSFVIRPWIRFSEKFATDDNPKMEDFIGVGDLTFVYTRGEQIFSLLVRSNMRLNKHYKGYLDFTWAYPIAGNLKATLHVGHGYGETLIDYNYKQTTIGLGVSLLEWL